jgi:hypothetical protein
VVDGAIATRATTPAVLSGREGGGRCRSVVVVLPGQEGSSVRLYNEHVVGGGVWQGAGVEGARRPLRLPSETTSLALLSSQGWTFDVRRRRWWGRRCCRAGGYKSRCWTTQLEGGGGDAKRRRRYGGRRRWMGSYPAAGGTAMDAAMPLSPPTDNGDD